MKFLKPSFYFIIPLLLLSLMGNAQFYVSGQDPASISWKQINSEYFNIIFPKGYENKAQEYINLLEISRQSVDFPYLSKNKKVKIVLHNRTVTSNAMVSPTPMHADFFEMPDQVSYAQKWDRQLTLHEYRHVVQMQKLHQGATNVLYYMFGDQAIGAIMGIFLPMWFTEGDAVFSETIYSKSGRGRSPNFTMDLKAQVIDKKIFSYDKALYGSFRDYVPDHYTLGYQLVTIGVNDFGYELWNSTLNKVAKQPFIIIPFTKSIKNITGKGKVGYYKNVLRKQQTNWLIIDSTKSKLTEITPKKQKRFANYRFPNIINKSNIIVEKNSIDNINQFVSVNNDGIEKVLFTPGYDFNNTLSANDSLLCWNEKTFDPRWSNRSYSVIKIYNYKNSNTKQITHKSRLFAPALANKLSKIVAVKVTEDNKYSLSILNFKDGNTTHEFSTPDNLFFMVPKWSSNDNYIISIVLGDKGKSIIKIDTKTWEYEFLIPFTFVDISRPIMADNKVIFSGTYLGTNDLYMIDLSNNGTYKITNVRFGASDATYYNNHIYFSNYTADGYRIAVINLDSISLHEVALNKIKSNYLIDSITTPNNFILDNETIPHNTFPIKNYSKPTHLFNPHSWGVTAVDLSNYSFAPGVSILTQNILSTAYGSVGYYYDPNEMTGKTKLSFEYAGWYPKISLTADYGLRRATYYDQNNIKHNIKWNETNLSLGFSIPLNLTNSKWITGITPYFGGTQKILSNLKNANFEFKEDKATSLTYNIFLYRQLKRSKQDIYPKWGISISSIYKHTVFSNSPSSIFGATGSIYLPGVFNHNGIRIYMAYQQQKTGNYSYGNIISLPRGYTGLNLQNMFSIKTDYALPLLYPDVDIPSIAYLTRVSAHVFFDYLEGKNNTNNINYYSSTGVEVYTDWHFFGLIPKVTLGFRSSYAINYKSVNFEFLYGFGF